MSVHADLPPLPLELLMRLKVLLLIMFLSSPAIGDLPRVFPDGEQPADSRLGELQNLNSYFPFKSVENKTEWKQRHASIERRLLISQGLWPEPKKTPLNAVVHRRVEFDDYSVEAVFFESLPGHYVTGSLYRPKGRTGPFPAVLCPHGHWSDARFYDAGEANAKKYIASGGERFLNAGRNHIQARCVQLARMGCIAFFYDMTGNCDSIQLSHRPNKSDHLDTEKNWGFFGVQAELRLQNMMGLQTWNSVRSIDFLLEQSDVDGTRIGVTGASGGGTQSMIIAAIDDRITAAMPCVMVSTSMQGGCTCENAPLMRIGQGNIDIAAAIAPRPLGLTAADDWTRELETKGYPDLQKLYGMLGAKHRLTAVFHTHFPHNYNHVNRTVMYGFFNRHFRLGFKEPVLERDFELMSRKQLTVWDDRHPAPSGTSTGDAHEISINRIMAEDSGVQMAALVPETGEKLSEFREVVGAAWETILGRRIDEVGGVEFTKTGTSIIDGFTTILGRIDHANAGEQLPMIQLMSTGVTQKGVVVWVGDRGKLSVVRGNDLIPEVSGLVRRGFTVVAADLIRQGEFVKDGTSVTNQPMWYQRGGNDTWHRFSGYTYGFNHSLFVQRTHDILTLIKYAKSLAKSQHVHLVGLDREAGPLVVAARSQAGDAINTTIADLHQFRFQQLITHDAPMFVSGAVKYFDVDGLLAGCAPHTLVVAGAGDATVPKKVYLAAEAKQSLTQRDADGLKSALEKLPQE